MTKTNRKQFATLFGGAMKITDSPEYLQTIEIGKLLAEHNYIVKNGGYGGMMEAVSKGASEAGGYVVGYTCATFGTHSGNKYLSTEIKKDDIYDRLRGLISGGDLFIVQKGGLGTLAELFLTLDVIRKYPKENQPKVILFGKFWKDIMSPILMTDKEKNLFVIIETVDEFKYLLNKYDSEGFNN
jgi:uncharacterized protein (TIGR00725 family)